MTNQNPIIVHIEQLLEQATQEQLRIIYQVVRAMIRPQANHSTQKNPLQ